MTWKILYHVLAIAALSAGATVLTPTVLTAEQRPFMARVAGNAQLSPTDDPCVLRNDETGAGEATHLGRFMWADVEYADFCEIPGGVAVIGWFTMTAANGDQLFGELKTTGSFDANGNLLIHGSYRFVGGSGRFANASGSGEIDAIGYLSPGLPFEGRLAGTINY